MNTVNHLPTREAANYLGLSHRTLEGMRCRGGGPAFLKLGRRVLYRQVDLDAWVESNLRTSTSDPGQAA